MALVEGEGALKGAVDAVEGGGDDAAGVTGAFAAGVEAGDVHVLEGFGVTGQAHRG